MDPAAGMFQFHPPPPFYAVAVPHPTPPFYYEVAVPHPTPPFYYAVPAPPPRPMGVTVRAVWANNLDYEFAVICQVARNARYVAIDVHYPGVVHGAGQNHNLVTAEERYAVVKANVDALKPLQVGVAICNDHGQHFAWEFNLRDFDRAADPHAANSLAYLAGRGLDVDTLGEYGIATARFAQKFLTCGLIDRPGLSWITYTGAYHVAYLLKIITGGNLLPQNMAGFLAVVQRFLGDEVYDVARMAADCNAMPMGLERIATDLGFAPPLASPRLAGAAGVRALQAFLTVKYGELRGNVSKYRGVLKGLQVI